MSTIRIKVDDYYGKNDYYVFMPPEIFDALEKAFKAGEEYAEVDKDLFDEMVEKYNLKNKQYEKSGFYISGCFCRTGGHRTR